MDGEWEWLLEGSELPEQVVANLTWLQHQLPGWVVRPVRNLDGRFSARISHPLATPYGEDGLEIETRAFVEQFIESLRDELRRIESYPGRRDRQELIGMLRMECTDRGMPAHALAKIANVLANTGVLTVDEAAWLLDAGQPFLRQRRGG